MQKSTNKQKVPLFLHCPLLYYITGNEVTKILHNLEIMKTILPNDYQPFVETLQAIEGLYAAVAGYEPQEDFEEKLTKFTDC